MQKTELKNLHFSMRYCQNTKRQTPIRLHKEEKKSNLSMKNIAVNIYSQNYFHFISFKIVHG